MVEKPDLVVKMRQYIHYTVNASLVSVEPDLLTFMSSKQIGVTFERSSKRDRITGFSH